MKKRLWAVTTERGALVYAGGQVLAFFDKASAKQAWKQYQLHALHLREVEIRSVASRIELSRRAREEGAK